MKKSEIKKILCLVTIGMLFLVKNVNAANAYSVGTKWPSGVYTTGDFTTNVTNAANAYIKLSGYNSYYSKQPSYSYLKSTSRLGGSAIFFINGHGCPTNIDVVYKNEDNYRTGISIYSDGWGYSRVETGNMWVYAGLDGRDMSKTKLISFVGCQTGAGSENLVVKAVNQGAKAALGFSIDISSRTSEGIAWLKAFNNGIGKGQTINTAIQNAITSSPSSNLSSSYVLKGNGNITLGTQKISASTANYISLNELSEDRESLLIGEEKIASGEIEDTPTLDDYDEINLGSSLYLASFKTNAQEQQSLTTAVALSEIEEDDGLTSIIDTIKCFDSTFNIDDYKIKYILPDQEYNNGYIMLTYYINGLIETNKVYLIKINDNQVTEIRLAGVLSDNKENIEDTNNNEIYNIATNFTENLKLESILNENSYLFKSDNILNEDNSINEDSLIDDAFDIEERFLYDYNTKKITYELTVSLEFSNETHDQDVIEINLN